MLFLVRRIYHDYNETISKGIPMPSWNEIQQMKKEELAAENERLAKKLIMHKIVIPIVVMTAVHFGVKYLLSKLPDAPLED
jgi:hypothetical protein